MSTIEWVQAGMKIPPLKERLLLIVSGAGSPPDAQLMGQSNIEVGYWTGETFRLTLNRMPAPMVSYWAALTPCLPPDIQLVHQREFDPDVRD